MSGRVRWERMRTVAGGKRIELRQAWRGCVGGAFLGSMVRGPHGGPWDVAWLSTRPVEIRRASDAKRWLLARAAGLAEVPTMRRPRRGRRGGRVDDVDGGTFYERNRRRR